MTYFRIYQNKPTDIKIANARCTKAVPLRAEFKDGPFCRYKTAITGFIHKGNDKKKINVRSGRIPKKIKTSGVI